MWEANSLRPSQPPAGRGRLGNQREGWLMGEGEGRQAGPTGGGRASSSAGLVV